MGDIGVSKENIKGLLAVMAGMIIFKASSYWDTIESLFREYTWLFILLGFILFFQRGKIANKIGR